MESVKGKGFFEKNTDKIALEFEKCGSYETEESDQRLCDRGRALDTWLQTNEACAHIVV